MASVIRRPITLNKQSSFINTDPEKYASVGGAKFSRLARWVVPDRSTIFFNTGSTISVQLLDDGGDEVDGIKTQVRLRVGDILGDRNLTIAEAVYNSFKSFDDSTRRMTVAQAMQLESGEVIDIEVVCVDDLALKDCTLQITCDMVTITG